MTINLDHLYSDRARNLVTSEIREILKFMRDPNLISFAGGMPNPDTFPISIIAKLANEVLNESISETLQYGVTEGNMPFREILADLMKSRKVDCDAENILVTSGAQQAVDLTSQLLLNQGTHVVSESPTFVATLIGFKGYGAWIDGVPLDDDGIQIDKLEEKLEELRKADIHSPLLYIIPNFQNPTGVTLSENRRKKIIDFANEFDMIVLEDDPYYDLRFEGDSIPPIKSIDDTGRVIYVSSFSKILSPGLRIGWIAATTELIRKIALIKQTADVCTNVLSQKIAQEYIAQGYLEKHLPSIRRLYGEKQRIMVSAMEKYFPKEAKWTHPEGGLFLWVELPEDFDTHELQNKALERNVAFIQGNLFFPDGSGKNTMRLSFSHPSNDDITEGIRRLGELINEEMRR